MHEISAQTGLYSQNSLDVEFGLADAVVVDSLRIEWPGGATQGWGGIAVNRFLTIYEGSEAVPVELESFTVRPDDGEVELAWITAAEWNSYGYEVQRRAGGIGFFWRAIGFVAVRGDGGGSERYVFVDSSAPAKDPLEYRLKIVDRDGRFSFSRSVSLTSAGSAGYALYQNYPNPFNGSTGISFVIPERCRVGLELCDVRGRRVRSWSPRMLEAGRHRQRVFAGDLPSGVYFARLSAGSWSAVIKMLLIK
jgi:hypothetical protein